MGTNTRRRSSRIKHSVILVMILVLATSALYWRWKRLAEKDRARCYFANAEIEPNPFLFKLELASTPAERAKGLMFRRTLKPDHGMLFIYPQAQKLSFWMKDTYIPLDMIFLDSAHRVVGILENVPVNNEKSRSIDTESQYAVEVIAGTVKRVGIKKGDVLKCQKPLPRGV